MIFRRILIGIFAALLFSTHLFAQDNRQYQFAVQLMQQQEYSKALPLLQELNADNPDNYPITDRLIDCYIYLKQYEEALTVSERYKGNPEHSGDINIRIGEIEHYKGNTEKAMEIWTSNLEANQNDLQLYITTAQTMVNRREYLAAVDVYKEARIQFQNDRIFFGDIASAYMQAGEYELAIDEWLALMEDSPGQSTFLQRSLLRYNDPILYDITIIELDERLANMPVSDPLYDTFYKLQIWLLQENKLYRRALATAKEFEQRTRSFNYSLFNLGRQLVSNNQFELAKEAFTFYTDSEYGEIKWRGLEELAKTYASWAKYIEDYNLDFRNERDSLYRLATVMLDSIETETNVYSGMQSVQLKRAELALDHVFDLDKARNALKKLRSMPEAQGSSEIPYIEGRIHLAQKEFPQARISLTRANKIAEIGEMAERTRYFLALTDFYSGDYEFAGIQLKSLGRNNTSYYANDALELRLWLQEGRSIDTTGANLARFADAVFKSKNGEARQSADLFFEFINDSKVFTLKDDALLFYVQSPHVDNAEKLVQLNTYLSVIRTSPLREKFMWERAKLTEQMNDTEGSESARELYEELILSFPQGFYAPYARERLTNLTGQNS